MKAASVCRSKCSSANYSTLVRCSNPSSLLHASNLRSGNVPAYSHTCSPECILARIPDLVRTTRSLSRPKFRRDKGTLADSVPTKSRRGTRGSHHTSANQRAAYHEYRALRAIAMCEIVRFRWRALLCELRGITRFQCVNTFRMTRSLATTYSQEQIDKYFSFIGFDDHHNLKSSGGNNIPYLNRLIKSQLQSIPFESLDIHFSKSRTICLDHQYLFDKFINPGNHRVGYCLENNLFFGIVLRSLGYEVLHVGGRVNRAAVSVDARCDGVGSPFRGW